MSDEISRANRYLCTAVCGYALIDLVPTTDKDIISSLLARVEELEQENEFLKGNHFTVGISPLKHHQDIVEATRSAFERAAQTAIKCASHAPHNGNRYGWELGCKYTAATIRNEMEKGE